MKTFLPELFCVACSSVGAFNSGQRMACTCLGYSTGKSMYNTNLILNIAPVSCAKVGNCAHGDQIKDHCCSREARESPNPDFTLIGDGCRIEIPRIILVDQSPFFDRLFMSNANTNVLDMDDVPVGAMEALQDFLVHGSFEGLVDCCDDLYDISARINIPRLQFECLDYMAGSMNQFNVIDRLIMAYNYGDKTLKKLSLKYVRPHPANTRFGFLTLSKKWIEVSHDNIALKKKVLRAINKRRFPLSSCFK